MNLESNTIKIYPITANYSNVSLTDDTISFSESTLLFRYLETRYLEQNIVSQYNNILDNKSFILCDNNNKIDNIISFKNNILYIEPIKFCIHGYIFEITKPLKISLSEYDYSDNKTWYIYFKIELERKSITYQYTQLPNYVLKGEDVNNLYTGLSLNVTEAYDFNENEESNNIYKLILGAVSIINGKTVFNYNKNLITKVNLDTMKISIDDSSISRETFEGTVEDWLNNYFILDDEKVGD